ncbi:MAG: HesB/IscA family protein, partial [Candidatus Acidiferrales bacterium]
ASRPRKRAQRKHTAKVTTKESHDAGADDLFRCRRREAKAMIHVTEKAAEKIRELLVKEGVPPESGGLRVGVQGGGCSGLSYAMRLETQARDRDKVIEENGARVFVDAKSFLYLANTTLDFEETLVRQGFVFQNPQATRSCGCGSSFTA